MAVKDDGSYDCPIVMLCDVDHVCCTDMMLDWQVLSHRGHHRQESSQTLPSPRAIAVCRNLSSS